jgi:predicted kinase
MVNTFFMLVGLPGVGKSTWAKKQLNATIISTDDIIQDIADKYGLTYNQIFDSETYSFVNKIAWRLAKFAFERNDNVIWDQTNLTINSRANKLKMVPGHYKKICVLFGVPDDLPERLNSRPGKVIPNDVMMNMIKSYQQPTTLEGFDDIVGS